MSAASLAARVRARPSWAALFAGVHALAIGLAFIPLLPVVWVMFTAVKPRGRVVLNPLGPPAVWHWENFPDAWQIGKFSHYFWNSIVVAVPTVLAILVFGMLAAYAFARMRFWGKDALFIVFLVGLTTPAAVLVIPLFYQLRDMEMLNTPWALIFPQVAFQLPFAILLLYSFIRDLPGEILDAGIIDGCSRLQLLRYIVAPLSTPVMVTLLVFTFMWSWNNFLLPVIFIQTDSARTLPVALNAFRGKFTTDIPMMMAGATITFLPVIVVYLVFQRQFIKGISAGALK